MFVLLKRIIKSGWFNFSHDTSLMVANVFIMTLAISVITSLFLFQETSKFLVNNLQEKVDISVYFKREFLEQEIFRVQEEISRLSEVKEVRYVSREEALDNFTDRHKDDSLLMEALLEVGVNPLLASLNIQAAKASQYDAIATFLENSTFRDAIDKIDYAKRKSVIERIFALTSNLNKIGLVMSIILALVAILVAFNSVRLAIYNSREEIRIQRLVGASDWFIRGPFLIQGAIVGFLASCSTFLVFLAFSLAFNSKIGLLFPSLNFFGLFLNNVWILLVIQFVSGVGLGVSSSLIAMRKYLEV